MVGGWSEGRSVEDRGAPLAFSFGEREETGRRCCDGVVQMVGFCRGRRGNEDDLGLWGKIEKAESFKFGQGKGKAFVG
jgi:hypothetical protein